MALSDTTVRQARITGNDYTIGDTDGLALNVTARGGKIWRFRYYWALVKIEGLEHNPASDLDVVALTKPPVTHNPFLRMDELPRLMAALRNYGGADQTRLGFQRHRVDRFWAYDQPHQR